MLDYDMDQDHRFPNQSKQNYLNNLGMNYDVVIDRLKLKSQWMCIPFVHHIYFFIGGPRPPGPPGYATVACYSCDSVNELWRIYE